MPSYLPGIQTYIPQIQPFTPDYNFYQGALELKQGRADAARKQLSSMYGSLLYAPLTREDNTEAREKFFDLIQQDIKKMSTMDLSLEQNVNAAMGVFNQLTDDNNIVHDMVWTKQYQQQMDKGQHLKNCPDPEKCGGSWWEGGDRLLNYSKEEYKRASKKDALRMSAPTYVAHQNVMEKAMKLAKDFDFNIKQDDIRGGYIVTTKNGALAEPMAQQLLFGTLGNDPKIAEYYKAQAQLQRKDFMYSNEAQYGSLEAAEQAYISQIETALSEQQAKAEEALKDKVETNKEKIKQVEAKKANALPDEMGDLEAYISELNNGVSSYEASEQKVKEVNGIVRNAKTKPTMSGYEIDALVSASSLQSDLGNAAKVLAYKDYEQSFQADPYALENVKFQHQMQAKQLDYAMKVELLKYEQQLKGGTKDPSGLYNLGVKGGAEHNVPDQIENIEGAAAPVSEEQMATRGYDQLTGQFNAIKTDVSKGERTVFNQMINRTAAEADKGNIQAKEDYVHMVTNLLGASAEDAKEFGYDGQKKVAAQRLKDTEKIAQSKANAATLRKIQGATTLAQKYRIAKQAGVDINALESSQVDLVYDAVMPRLLSQDKTSKFTREYLAPMFKNQEFRNNVRNIEAKDAHLKQMGTWYKGMTDKVAQSVKADASYNIKMQDPKDNYEQSGGWWANEVTIDNKVLGDAIQSYIGNDGSVVNGEQFIKSMVAKGHSRVVADALYNGGRNDPGMTDYLASWGDAVGTTLAGIFTLGYKGFDYDTATSWANREAAGEVDKTGYSNDKVGYGAETIHDLFKKAVTQYGKPDGDMAWGNVTGMGNYVAKGQHYKVVDPAASTSVGAMGMKGVFDDFFNNSGSVVSMGGFSAEKPEENDETALEFLKIVQSDFYRNPTGKNRPQLSVTYSDVAGSDPNTIGVNIKAINKKFLDDYKGSEKNKGLFYDNYNQLMTEGVTLYMDRDKASNIFTTASQKTSLEHLMSITGKVPMDNVAGGYTDNFNISVQDNGTYKASGMIQTGLTPEGLPNWDYFETTHPGVSDVNSLVQSFDQILSDLREQNEALRMTWLKQRASGI